MQFRRNPNQASVAVKSPHHRAGTLGRHAPAAQNTECGGDILVPIGQLRTNRAAAVLGELLAKESLITSDQGSDGLEAVELFRDYVQAAAPLNNGHPVIDKDLLRRADAWVGKSDMPYQELEKLRKGMPGARTEAIERLKKFFAARASAKDDRRAASDAAAASPELKTPSSGTTLASA